MFCKKCGAKLRDGAVFCHSCGTKATRTEASKITHPTVTPSPESTTVKPDSPQPKRFPFLILGLIIVALIAIIVVLLLDRKGAAEGADTYRNYITKEQNSSSDADEQTSPSVTEEIFDSQSANSEDAAISTDDSNTVENDSQDIFDISQEELEAEILRIREVWTTDKDAISNASFDISEPQSGIQVYSSANDIKMIEVKSGILNEYNMTFQIENGNLTFAYYESPTSQIRLYYKDEKLIRWIQTDAGADPVIHDLEYDNETFLNNEQLALNDLSSILHAEHHSDTSSITMDSIVSIQASSYLIQKNFTHSPEYIADGTLQNAWVEGASGQGVGEWIQFTFNGTYSISGFQIYSGYQKNTDLYQQNSRPKDIRIVFSDSTEESFTLDDNEGIQTVYFSNSIATDTLTLYIESVYSGTKYEDTVISEMNLF